MMAMTAASFNATEHFGSNHVLPSIADSGRWANLPLCRPAPAVTAEVVDEKKKSKPHHHLVACTWTSASYLRRGDATVIGDSAARLKEWIVFHKLVGMDHIYVYDNTQPQQHRQNDADEGVRSTSAASPLQAICAQFPDTFVTFIPWPATVCSNNRPNFKNPGERSSQYAAEAACRSRYGDLTEWMAFIDTDEYLVPMRGNETWHGVLRDMEKQNVDILQMRSSRGRPRLDYMEVTDDPDVCVRQNNTRRSISKLPEEACAVPRRNETYLRVYK